MTNLLYLAGKTSLFAADIADDLKDGSGPSSSSSWMKPSKKLEHEGSSPSSHLTSPFSSCLTLPGPSPTLTVDQNHNTSSDSQNHEALHTLVVCVVLITLQPSSGYALPKQEFSPAECNTSHDTCNPPSACCPLLPSGKSLASLA